MGESQYQRLFNGEKAMDSLTAHQEDILTLRNVLGLDEELAETLLAQSILVSFDPSDGIASKLFIFLRDILSRTVTNVSYEATFEPDIEIVINKISTQTGAQKIFVATSLKMIEISKKPIITQNKTNKLHGSLLILGATYIAAFALRKLIGPNPKLPPEQDNNILNFDSIFSDLTFLDKEIDFKKTYLAGGGAIGNAFLYALKEFKVKGELVIADPDFVSDGNLNRCIWFTNSELNKNKAKALSEIAQPNFKELKLLPHSDLLNTVPDRNSDSKWLKRLVVAVDSRRARRNIQTEIPGEVFDASTTNIEEVVLHFHKRPLNGSACLECVYPHDVVEDAHEKHIAESLGVLKTEITELNVSEIAAKKIASKYPFYKVDELVGLSYDTLFKQLCGQDKLKLDGEKQILAPFAFVSILAGTMLAIETVRRTISPFQDFNFWKISPWTVPQERLKQNWPSSKNCSFCNDKVKSDFADRLWS